MLKSYLLAKILGALGGVVISVAVLFPETKKEAISRASVGMVCGFIFAAPLMDYLDWTGKGFEHWLSASALCAFLGWFVFGIFARTASKWKTLQDVSNDVKEIKDDHF